MEQKMGRLGMDLEKVKVGKLYKRYKAVSKDLNNANIKVRANRIEFLYNMIDKNFRELLWEMQNFAKIEPEIHKTYRQKVIDFLEKGLQEENKKRVG